MAFLCCVSVTAMFWSELDYTNGIQKLIGNTRITLGRSWCCLDGWGSEPVVEQGGEQVS